MLRCFLWILKTKGFYYRALSEKKLIDVKDIAFVHKVRNIQFVSSTQNKSYIMLER